MMVQICLFADEDLPAMRETTWLCMVCGAHTGDIDEFYMVTDEVWIAAIPSIFDQPAMLCIGCLEGRLERTLKSDDFTDCEVNSDHVRFCKSKRLLARLHDQQGG